MQIPKFRCWKGKFYQKIEDVVPDAFFKVALRTLLSRENEAKTTQLRNGLTSLSQLGLVTLCHNVCSEAASTDEMTASSVEVTFASTMSPASRYVKMGIAATEDV
ncbi:unnamed protein product [Protopolystoma xenopodis]|uniref:Uncharacterized protein n=1 Tax=Protopolystoma xenopodis TaxID=117903 RepID=A0A3S5AE98_9PLAT|nr:unnamed protein product [Protopolystoma xenopodis]